MLFISFAKTFKMLFPLDFVNKIYDMHYQKKFSQRKQLFVAYIQGDTQNSTRKCLQHLALTGPALSRMTSRGRLQPHDHVASLIFLYVCSVLLFIKDGADGKDAATQGKGHNPKIFLIAFQ